MAKFALGVFLAGAGAACAVVWTQKNGFKAHTRPSSAKWDSNWDHRVESKENEKEVAEKKEKRGTTRHILLIRHGNYERNAAGEKVLTTAGRWQATLTGQRLRDLNHPYSVIYHSTMPRAAETADLIHGTLPEIPLVSCDLLREGAPAIPDPPVSHWTPKPHEFFSDGARIEAAFRKYFYRSPPEQKHDSFEIIVCHANVIRYFVCRALQLPPEAWLRFSIGHCSVTAVIFLRIL
eukprot:Em0011g34a